MPSATLLEALADAATDTVVEVRRRVPDHFAREPLVLPAEPALRALVQAVAELAQVPARAGPAAADDRVHALLMTQLREAGADRLAIEGAASLREGMTSMAARVQARAAAWRDATPPRFAALPGLQRRERDGVRWLRCGRGPEALLLVNAFGLTLDVWHDLVRALGPRFTVLALDDDDAAHAVPRTSYATPDAPARCRAAVATVLAGEGLARCHVASWCSGGKLALELARALPGAIASLALFAPSFAGTACEAGGDSAFESSLHTMGQVVERMPQSAGSMAASMLALLKKGAGAGASSASLFELADAATLPWLHAPFASAAAMVEYSRQLLNFRAHALHDAPLALPVLLVTGECDAATSSARAAAICGALARPVHVELRAASHYFIHQNAALAARLLGDFVRDGAEVVVPHARFVRVAAEEPLVCGEL